MALNSIKKNTVYNAAKTVSSIVFPMISFPYVSRVLLPDNVGKVNFSLSFVSYFSLIASLGITTYAVRECSTARENKERLDQTASQIFSINIITTMIAYLCLAIALFVGKKLASYQGLILICSMGIIATTVGADWLNSAMEDLKYITIRTILFQALSLVLMFCFVHNPDDYYKYALIYILSVVGPNVVNVWYRRRFCKVRFTWKIEWGRHAKPIFFLFAMSMAQTVFNNIDSTMLGLMRDDYEVGIYSTAHNASNLIIQLITSLHWVIMPRMSLYFAKRDYPQINKLVKKVFGFNALFGLPLAVGTFMMSNDIILIFAGEEYLASGHVLQVLMIGFVFTLFGGSVLGNVLLLPSKREKLFMYICCVAAIVNVITNYIFIPLFGSLAAAATTAFCALVILVLLLFTIDKNIKINGFFRIVITPVIGCGVIVVVCFLSRGIESLVVRDLCSVLLSAVLYGVVSIIGKNELAYELLPMLKKKKEKNDQI